jgi:NAD(P)-dependent dehydrogenase (short-subunit alcohol dehydrogenase family)
MPQPNGRIAVITGASSGIGKEVAKALAGQGWKIIATGRDEARMEQALAEIRAAGDRVDAVMLRADLSLMKEAIDLADRIGQITDLVDVLINNAGGMTDRLVMTAEGLEENYAANHLGPFLLTERILPLLKAAAADSPAGSVRILMTSSDAGEMIPAIDLNDLQNLSDFSPGHSYCAGKLANVLFARGLAARLEGSGIVAHAMAPGPVASNFYSTAPAQTREHVQSLSMLSERDGADTLIWLATADEPGVTSGGYWEKRAPRKPNRLAEDPAFVDRFWDESARLVAGAVPRQHPVG